MRYTLKYKKKEEERQILPGEIGSGLASNVVNSAIIAPIKNWKRSSMLHVSRLNKLLRTLYVVI